MKLNYWSGFTSFEAKSFFFFFNDYMFSIMNEVGSLPPPVAMFTDVCFVYKVQEL